MKIKNYFNSFLVFFLLGLIPFIILTLLEKIFLGYAGSFDTTVVQASVSSVFSGILGCLINFLKPNKVVYRILLAIYVILFLIVMSYALWVFYFELEFSNFTGEL